MKVGLRTFHEGLVSNLEHKICPKEREHTRYVPEEENHEQNDMYIHVLIFAIEKEN